MTRSPTRPTRSIRASTAFRLIIRFRVRPQFRQETRSLRAWPNQCCWWTKSCPTKRWTGSNASISSRRSFPQPLCCHPIRLVNVVLTQKEFANNNLPCSCRTRSNSTHSIRSTVSETSEAKMCPGKSHSLSKLKWNWRRDSLFRCCNCNCQRDKNKANNQKNSIYNVNNNNSNMDVWSSSGKRKVTDEGCQTLSTGDIVITKMYFQEDQDKMSEKVITASPKKTA